MNEMTASERKATKRTTLVKNFECLQSLSTDEGTLIQYFQLENYNFVCQLQHSQVKNTVNKYEVLTDAYMKRLRERKTERGRH